MHYTGRNQLFSCVNYFLSHQYIFRYLPTAFQFAVIPVHLTRQRAKMKLIIVALTGLVALVASQDATSTSTSLTPQQSCATKCTFCNFRDTHQYQADHIRTLQVTLPMYAAMLHAIRSHAPTTPWQTRPPLAQLPVFREMVPPTKLRPMPGASRLASALYSSPEPP
jgi:hypothetical protein